VKMYSTLPFFLALFVLGTGPISARADTIIPGQWNCSATVSDGEGVSTGNCDGTSGGTLLVPPPSAPDSARAKWPPPDTLFSVVTGMADATVQANPLITVGAQLSQANNPYPFGLGYADASASLNYGLIVGTTQSSKLGGLPLQVPVNMLGTVLDLNGLASYSVTVVNGDTQQVVYSLINGGVPEISVPFSQQLTLNANTLYVVFETIEISIQQTTASDFASIDPVFTIDPSFAYASDYQLIFSPGILNAEATTPLPATLPLFAGGLGVMGLIARRRKPKASVPAPA
jgi:hypothetical protein